MANNTTSYKLLISCPSDVNYCVDKIKEEIHKFNKRYGERNGIYINSYYWREDIYPVMGINPQDLINQQIVDSSDMNIAVFWNRFGEPTKNYASGTEEEIERMLSNDKQVFIYFLNKPVPVEEISDQTLKVKDFKQRHKQDGVYIEVTDEESLLNRITIDLERYFEDKKK